MTGSENVIVSMETKPLTAKEDICWVHDCVGNLICLLWITEVHLTLRSDYVGVKTVARHGSSGCKYKFSSP